MGSTVVGRRCWHSGCVVAPQLDDLR